MVSYLLDNNKKLHLVSLSAFNWVKQQLTQPNTEDQQFYASNFVEIEDLPDLPTELEENNTRNFEKLQDHLVLKFSIRNHDFAQTLQNTKKCLADQKFTRNYLIFPLNTEVTDNNTIELLMLIPTTRLITNQQHDWYIENVISKTIKTALQKATNGHFHIDPTSQFIWNINPQKLSSPEFAISLDRGPKNNFIIDRDTLKKEHLLSHQADKEKDKKKNKKKDEIKVQYSNQKLRERLSGFIKEEKTKQILKDEKALRRMFSALANDQWTHSYPENFHQQVIERLSTLKVLTRSQLDLIYREELARLKHNPSLRMSAPKFGEYLQIYKDTTEVKENLSTQLLAALDGDFEPSDKVPLNTAIEKIAESYPPALIKGASGQDKDNVVIFDPLTGMWRHDENDFYALLTALRPSSTAMDKDTMLRTLGAQARNQNAFIVPYHRTAHYLFNNCVVERRTRKIHKLNEDYVRNLHFTERAKLHINYDPTVTTPPVFKNKLLRVKNGDWNPEDFMRAYAGNDNEKLKLLYFLLSLGLFGSHNSRINVSFQGTSRWGKTTLLSIFNGLYANHTFNKTFGALNSQFGFTSYQPNSTSIIWFSECNIGGEPLNDTYGTPRYDGLADVSVSFEVKKAGDITLQNPPQVYVDGTSFLPAKELNTGPAGRTLVFKFPTISSSMTKQDIEKFKDQAYAIGITDLLQNEKVLQYLVNRMMDAFNTEMGLQNENPDRLDNLELTISGADSDLKYLPDFEQKWRKEMINSQGDVGRWFKDEFEEYLVKTSDVRKATTMHDDFAYLLYQKSYLIHNAATDKFGNRIIGKDRFARQLHTLYETHNWAMKTKRDSTGSSSRRIISSLNKTNFNFTKYRSDGNETPDSLNNTGKLPYPFGKRDRNWYELITTDNGEE